jgi:beta-galactosidase
MARRQSVLNTQTNQICEKPVIVPLPGNTAGVQTPVISLNGTWKLNVDPPREFWSNAIDPASWIDVAVPGFTPTQGYVIEENHEYAYRTRVPIPPDWAGQTILLRFDGVTGYARVWIDGRYVRDHYGGFTSWYCDLTGHVSPGQDAWLTVGVTNKAREISVFNFGGIIRDVRLVAVPPGYVTRLQVETELDGEYRDATLKVTAGMTAGQGDQVKLALKDPRGEPVDIRPSAIELTPDQPEATVKIPVPAPDKWDAEHPNLYTLEAVLVVDGRAVESLSRQVGFREVKVLGNKLYVNGREVKLRGVNRHDIYPKTGRAITPELVERDVQLLRAANVNFVRTSHYPPREDFLEACDRGGIYVEDEITVAFVYQSIQPTENDPDFAPYYVNQFAEMIERDRSHPCVIMWSLANESYWGSNFQREYDHAKRVDPGRPVIFSYPITMPEGTRAYDIWSLHYASYDCDAAEKTDNFSVGKSWGRDAPVLHDEYAHGPCYDLPEQMRDPAVREFWGESIKRFWENIASTDGALGGAIWGGIDEVMITPEGYSRAREWGIVDGWRREKPEHWLTKKGYSPIRVQDGPLANPGSGKRLRIPIKNWFDHANLDEVAVHWTVGEDAGVVSGPAVEPHAEGVLEIPARDWRDGEILHLQFYRPEDLLVDEYNLPVGSLTRSFPGPQGPPPSISRDGENITISGTDFSITFDTKTGLIAEGSYQGSEIIKGGPYLNLVGIPLAPWSPQGITAEIEGNEAVVTISGSCGSIEVQFQLQIDGQGLITTTYSLDHLPPAPRARRLRVGLDVGGYREVGVAYILSSAVDRFTWERKGLWSAYPEDHIGRTSGTAYRMRQEGDESYGAPPAWPWGQDMREYALFGRYDVGGRGTKDFRSMKHNIWYASAVLGGSEKRVRAESDGSDAVRLEVLDRPGAKIDDRDPAIRYVGTWIPIDSDGKSYCGTEMYSSKAGDYAEFTFRGTGICWIGSKDLIHGKADVYVDGVKEASGIDLYCGIGHGASRGEEKIYQELLFSKEGLENGEHVIRIVVTGEKNAASNNAFVAVDAFEVLGTPVEGDVKFIVNNEWNYPELTWGNYVKDPILIESGYTNSLRIRLTNNDRYAT